MYLDILMQVLTDLKIEFWQLDKIWVKAVHNNSAYYFLASRTPFNNSDAVFLSERKAYCHQLLANFINCPKTISYFDTQRTTLSFVNQFSSTLEIIKDIENSLKYPIIIKPSSGCRGLGVYSCNDRQGLEIAIEANFNQNSKNYDMTILAQETIEIACEYRVICINKIVELVYLKDTSTAKFTDNLSPLHWKGSKALLVEDMLFLEQIQKFVNPIFKQIQIFWVGIDIAIDKNGKMWLIEINSAPGLSKYLENNSEDKVYQLYQKAITKYFNL